jgi:YYY domain-containing protein
VRNRSVLALNIALLALLVIVGGALRVTDINWDRFQHVHPDERFIVWVADTMKQPADLRAALDPARSTLNPFRWPPDAGDLAGQPRNYAYGHFPLYLLLLVAHAGTALAGWLESTTLAFPAFMQPLHTVGRHLVEYAYLGLVGRAISALADIGTLLLVYWLANRAFPSRYRAAGLLAAAGYTFAVLPIQLSHFATVDAVLTFCITATVACAVAWATLECARSCRAAQALTPYPLSQPQAGRGESLVLGGEAAQNPQSEVIAQRPGRGWLIWLLAGVMAGLAVGSKFSAVLIAVPLLVAALHRLPPAPLNRRAAIVAGRMAAVGLVALFTFALTNPFSLIEFRAYIQQITAQNAMVSGAMDAPYTRQYIGTLPYLYFVQQLAQWGLGWPLGIAAWAGLVWAVVQFGRGIAGPAVTIMLAWALPYFATTGVFHAKFMRYMAPLLPFLLIFAAGMALAAYDWLSARWSSRGRAAWWTIAAAVALVTLGWSLAFVQVYNQEHPWIAASEWIYRHVPDGAKVLTEHWDDALPLALDELAGKPPTRNYRRVELPLWDDDSAAKLDTLVAELSTADYIFLSSNRLYAPIQRLASRYPMASNYYRMLFDGDLGYRLVAEFDAYPQIGPLTIRDDHADESFTVYDHPHVYIFENTEKLREGLLRARLERYLPQAFGTNKARRGGVTPPLRGQVLIGAFSRAPGHASYTFQNPAPGAALTLDQPVDTLPVVADYRWNRIASEDSLLAVAWWWLVASMLGWIAWPLLFPLLRGLADRGYGLSRAFGLLVLGWVHWLGVSLGLWQNRLLPLLVIVLALAVAGRLAWAARKPEIVAFRRAVSRLLLFEEAIFAAAFLLFAGIRTLNPDLWQPWNGGEKFMEFAFLNAILRSPHFPPYDPYFAGGIINYYYFGLYLVSAMIKLTGVYAEVAFNLAIPLFFALTATGVFSVAFTLASRTRLVRQDGLSDQTTDDRPSSFRRAAGIGLLAIALTLLMGNLDGVRWLKEVTSALVTGAAAPAYDYWAASRVIPYTINEFPLWTFTFADLHPHLIAMPFGVLVIGLALDWVLTSHSRLTLRQDLLKLVALIISLGALGAINTWDLPTYALLIAGACVIRGWHDARLRGAIAGLVAAAAVAGLAVAAYWPFYDHYVPLVGGGEGSAVGRFLGMVTQGSPLKPWLSIWGVFLFLAASYLVVAWRERTSKVESEHPERRRHEVPAESKQAAGAEVELPHSRTHRGWLIAALGVCAVAAVLVALGYPTAATASVPLCLALPLMFQPARALEDRFVALLLAMGLAVVVGIEVVYLRDFLAGGEWYRMNTLFKFSVPAWLFLGLAGSVMLDRAWAAANRARSWIGLPWQTAMAGLLALGFIFLAVGVRARVDDRFPGARPAIGTLDGTAYMTVAQYTWPNEQHVIKLEHEREAIRWLLENVKGSPVIAEAPAATYSVDGADAAYDYYRAGGLRVASLTGLPTFLGQHQYEQRPGSQVGQRQATGQEFFQTTDVSYAQRLMAELRVGYIYVGVLERLLFSPDALRKFDVLVDAGVLEVAYQNPDVTIYHVVQ